MREPYRKRRINVPPRFNNFKPSGVPRRFLKVIDLTLDEYESLRLTDYLQLEHLEASEKMNISRPTFTRLIEKARHKVAQTIVNGRELIIGGGNIDFVNTLHRCRDCGEITLQSFSEESKICPDCGSSNVENLAMNFMKRGRHRRGRFK